MRPGAPTLLCITLVVLAAPAPRARAGDAAQKTPAQWVAQLAAQDPAQRDEASAALLVLGGKARDAVQAALDSKDPAIESAANELWKTLRWDVVPGAEEDIARFLNPPSESWQLNNIWVYFKKKYGMQTLRLIAEFHDGKMEKTDYHLGLMLLVGFSPPEDTARFIKAADPAMRKKYTDLLGILTPGANGPLLAGHVVRLYSLLGDDEKAYRYGCAAAAVSPSLNADYDNLISASADAARGAGLLSKLQTAALADIKAEANADRLCAKLCFYSSLMARAGKKNAITPLCDAAAGRLVKADDYYMRCTVETMLARGMPGAATKALTGVTGVLPLYMRSSLALKAGDKAASAADWDAAMKIIDSAQRNEAKKYYWLYLGDLMHDWHDPRAADFLQKVLSVPPEETGYDALACFQLGDLMQEQANSAKAIGFYEKGLGLCEAMNYRYSTNTPDGFGVQFFMLEDDAAPYRDKLAKLKAAAPAAAPQSTPASGAASGTAAPEAAKPHPPPAGDNP